MEKEIRGLALASLVSTLPCQKGIKTYRGYALLNGNQLLS